MTQPATIQKTDEDKNYVPVSTSVDSADSHTSLVRTLTEIPQESSLSCAIARHIGVEKASFHTPGHKGRRLAGRGSVSQAEFEKRDLTELPGLDDLSRPASTLLSIERRAARLWRSHECLISVNGASAALIAAILCLSGRGNKILIPRNAHRSAVSALTLSGLEPIWYEPVWDSKWGTYGSVSPHLVEQLLEEHAADPNNHDVAMLLLTSPTYGGAISDIESIARHCRRHNLPLIVDEAHGAHLGAVNDGSINCSPSGSTNTAMPASAISLGATMVVHSLHKTLSAFTQCGVLHICTQSISREEVRRALNLVQTSSPSYPLLASIEDAIELLELEGEERLGALHDLRMRAEAEISAMGFSVFNSRFRTDPLHLLVRSNQSSAPELFEFLADRGVFPEAILGDAVLLLMGIGTTEEDIRELIAVLGEFKLVLERRAPLPEKDAPSWKRIETDAAVQVFTPRRAFFMPSEVVAARESIGRVAAECIAPCPPGIPICVPGQRITDEILNLTDIKFLRVLCEPSTKDTSDGSTYE
ncbi:MAG TPA: aminotransferase class I/II-fold pyridoxal phosphate-dependent enzyme [Chroococcales cyanobacterium]